MTVFQTRVPDAVTTEVRLHVMCCDCSRHVFPMLSLLKSDCSPQDLEEALQDAMDLVDSVEQRHHHNPQHRPQQPEPQPTDDKEKAEEFVKEMLDSGFSKTLALKAMKEVGVEDIAEGEGQNGVCVGNHRYSFL